VTRRPRVHVYAPLQWQAVAWLRSQRLPARWATLVGDRSLRRGVARGARIEAGDRVVVLGVISSHAEYQLRVRLMHVEGVVPVERLPALEGARDTEWAPVPDEGEEL
jgi:hypothetical protein